MHSIFSSTPTSPLTRAAALQKTGKPAVSRAPGTLQPLYALEEGQSGLIVSVEDRLQELAGLGVAPNAVVHMVANYTHHLIFNVGCKKLAADKETAAGIAVRWLG